MATTKIRKEDVQLPKEFKDCLAFVLYNVFTEKVRKLTQDLKEKEIKKFNFTNFNFLKRCM